MDSNLIVLVDTAGIIRFWSAAAYGHSPEQAVGQTLDIIVPSQYRDAHWQGFRRAMGSGKAAVEGQVAPFAFRRADGEIEPVQGRLTLLRQAQDRVIGAMVVFG